MRRVALAVMAFWLLAARSLAVEPDEVLKDPALESRARHISAELRCLVCQNQSIDDSDAELARDLRVLVRDRLKAGDSDAAVRDYVVSRYGEFVLLRPVFGGHTLLLWLAPLLVLVLGGIGAYAASRRRATQAPSLAPEERAAIERLVRDLDRSTT